MKLPFNPDNRKSQIGVAIVLVLLIAAFATQCQAESYAQFGYGRTVSRGETGVLDLSIVWPDAGPKEADLAVGATFIGQSTLYGLPQRNQFAWYAQVIDGFKDFEVSLGVAYMQNEDIYNSCHLQFLLGLGYRFRTLPITARLQHFSNGSTCSPNKGRDMLVLAWRF